MIMNREMERTFFALPMPLAEQEQRSDEDAHVQQRYVDGKRHRVADSILLRPSRWTCPVILMARRRSDGV